MGFIEGGIIVPLFFVQKSFLSNILDKSKSLVYLYCSCDDNVTGYKQPSGKTHLTVET